MPFLSLRDTIGSSIKSTSSLVASPLFRALRDRGEPDSLKTAEKIKEEFCYVCPDIVKEFARYDREPERFGKHTINYPERSQCCCGCWLRAASWLPKSFFNPEIYSSDFLTSARDC